MFLRSSDGDSCDRDVLHKLRPGSRAFLRGAFPVLLRGRLHPRSHPEEPPALLSSVKQGWIISSLLITFLVRQATIMIRVIESHASGISLAQEGDQGGIHFPLPCGSCFARSIICVERLMLSVAQGCADPSLLLPVTKTARSSNSCNHATEIVHSIYGGSLISNSVL